MGGFKIKVNRTYSCANVINIDGKDVVIPKGKINPPEGLPLVAPTEEDIKIGFVSPVRRYEALDRCTAAANVI